MGTRHREPAPDRGNVQRMCQRYGTRLGACCHDGTQYWVCDGRVWEISEEAAIQWGDYFEFMRYVRDGQISGWMAA